MPLPGRLRASILPLATLFLLAAPVVARAADAPKAASSAAPSSPTVTVDTSQLKTVEEFAAKANDLIQNGYPKILEILGTDHSYTPEHVTVVMDLGYDGVAATGGTVIHVSPKYVQQHPDDTGMLIHELTHVAQHYPKYDPVWLVEGIADYVRFFHFEPVKNRPHPNPARANARASYRTTAAFLDWASRKYNPNLVKKLDQALKEDKYTEGTFQELTGKSLDQLNTEWIESLKAEQATKANG